MPILEHYCETGDTQSTIRIWQQMRAAPGTYLDSRTYALMVGALARRGVFALNTKIESTESVIGGGPELLNQILMGSQKDIYDITDQDALDLFHAFKAGFRQQSQHQQVSVDHHHDNLPMHQQQVPRATNAVDGWWQHPDSNHGMQVMVGRVDVDPVSSICPVTGAKLRLRTLAEGQRTLMRDTLVNMADVQQRDFASAKKHRQEAGGEAKKELIKFEEWLQYVFMGHVYGYVMSYIGTHTTATFVGIQEPRRSALYCFCR